MGRAEEAIRAARARLKAARTGLADMRRLPDRYDSGLMTAVVFGRQVTLSLQNMQGHVDGWEEWYAPQQAALKADPLMQFFVTLRNAIEKQVAPQTSVNAFINGLVDVGAVMRQSPPPAGATGFMIGHAQYGGASGWMVKLADGSEEFVPVTRGLETVVASVHFRNAPDSHRQEPVEVLLDRYLARLGALVEAAAERFDRPGTAKA